MGERSVKINHACWDSDKDGERWRIVDIFVLMTVRYSFGTQKRG
jgi:hypothetical protein